MRLTEKIKQIFHQHGVELIGFTPFELVKMPGNRKAAESIQTVIIAAFPYLPPGPYERTNLSLYARSRDYHQVIRTLLVPVIEDLKAEYPDSVFIPFTDNSPVLEVRAAALAGLGCIGKNGLLITPQHGSYVFLGGLLTDLVIETALSEPAGCSGCGQCIASCPTGALTVEGFEKAKCLSAITQKKGTLTPEEEQAIQSSGMVWGCDECQLSCPMNRDIRSSPFRDFTEDILSELTESDVDTDLSDRAFIWRGTDVLRRNLKLTKPKN